MFPRLIILFTLIPLLELYVLLEVGALIGAGWTVGLILLTGIAGAWLARTQGFELLRQVQREMAAGRLPAEQLLDGAMILAGGILLLTPGFCTDLAGFAFLTPGTRSFIKKILRRALQQLAASGKIHIHRP